MGAGQGAVLPGELTGTLDTALGQEGSWEGAPAVGAARLLCQSVAWPRFLTKR